MSLICCTGHEVSLNLFQLWNIIFRGGKGMEYLTASEISLKWGISSRRVRTLCNEGRISGAFVKGNLWLIPENAIKPEEHRRGRKTRMAS